MRRRYPLGLGDAIVPLSFAAVLVACVVGLFAAIHHENKAKAACKASHGSWEVVDRIYIPGTTTYDSKGYPITTPGYWLDDMACIPPKPRSR